jgi:hypothetical protein
MRGLDLRIHADLPCVRAAPSARMRSMDRPVKPGEDEFSHRDLLVLRHAPDGRPLEHAILERGVVL